MELVGHPPEPIDRQPGHPGEQLDQSGARVRAAVHRELGTHERDVAAGLGDQIVVVAVIEQQLIDRHSISSAGIT